MTKKLLPVFEDAITVVACIVVLAVCGCAALTTYTPEKKLLLARTELNTLMIEYIAIQDSVSDEDRAVAKSVFADADELLDTWEANLSAGYNYAQDMDAWLNWKTTIVRIINKYRGGA